MKYLEDAVQKDANNPRAWLALAKLRQQSGDLPQALQNYQQSLAINPAQPMAAAEVAKLNHQISGNAQTAMHHPVKHKLLPLRMVVAF